MQDNLKLEKLERNGSKKLRPDEIQASGKTAPSETAEGNDVTKMTGETDSAGQHSLPLSLSWPRSTPCIVVRLTGGVL